MGWAGADLRRSRSVSAPPGATEHHPEAHGTPINPSDIGTGTGAMAMQSSGWTLRGKENAEHLLHEGAHEAVGGRRDRAQHHVAALA